MKTKKMDDIVEQLEDLELVNEVAFDVPIVRLVDFLTVGFAEVSKQHDELHKPKATERKANAEVSTPYVLRQEMLDKIPVEFWTTPKTVFEPCCGKGGFLIDIVDRFMSGLTVYEPEEQLRFKLIIEECIFFADINPVNIFICKDVLFGLEGVTPNFYLGDTLTMDVAEAFPKLSNSRNERSSLRQFDAVIGNPPYNKGGVRSHTGKKLSTTGEKNVTIWPDFVRLAFDLLKRDGYLSYVHPLSWMKQSHSVHSLLMSKTITWIMLWDNAKTKFEMGAEIPVTSYVVKNTQNDSTTTTIIHSVLSRRGVKTTSNVNLSSFGTIPLAYHSIFSKIQTFIKERNCHLDVKHDCVKINKANPRISLPVEYDLTDNYAVDTFTIKGGLMVRKVDTIHPSAHERKLILANKASYIGSHIDDGRLGLCGNDKFYILGEYLEIMQRFFTFKINGIVCHYTKYRQDFLERDSFAFIPDVRKLSVMNITEKEYYVLLGLTDDEIHSIVS
jgi:hypothetical protein